MLNELSKFFLGNTHDTTMMVTFFGTLAHDSDNKNFSAKMEKCIGPKLGNNEERWEVHFEDSKEVAPESMLIEDAAATATEGIGKLVSVQPTETMPQRPQAPMTIMSAIALAFLYLFHIALLLLSVVALLLLLSPPHPQSFLSMLPLLLLLGDPLTHLMMKKST